MKLEFSDVLAGTVKAIAAASIIGGGTVVLNTNREVSKHDLQIQQLNRDVTEMNTAAKELRDTVQSLDKNVAVLNERMKERR